MKNVSSSSTSKLRLAANRGRIPGAPAEARGVTLTVSPKVEGTREVSYQQCTRCSAAVSWGISFSVKGANCGARAGTKNEKTEERPRQTAADGHGVLSRGRRSCFAPGAAVAMEIARPQLQGGAVRRRRLSQGQLQSRSADLLCRVSESTKQVDFVPTRSCSEVPDLNIESRFAQIVTLQQYGIVHRKSLGRRYRYAKEREPAFSTPPTKYFFRVLSVICNDTGAASGIGRAICQRFLADGLRVAAVDINPTADACASDSGSSKTFVCDVGHSQDVSKLVQGVRDWAGVPSVVVNAAGIVRENFLLKMTEEQFDEVIRVNLKVCLKFSALNFARFSHSFYWFSRFA